MEKNICYSRLYYSETLLFSNKILRNIKCYRIFISTWNS